MVYLARMEDAVTAQIIWAFDFSKSNLKIKDVKLTFNTMTYEDGNVDVEFSYKGTFPPFYHNFFQFLAKKNNSKANLTRFSFHFQVNLCQASNMLEIWTRFRFVPD